VGSVGLGLELRLGLVLAEMGTHVRDSDSSRASDDSSHYFWDLRLACNDLRLDLKDLRLETEAW